MNTQRLIKPFQQIDARVRVSPMAVGHGAQPDEPGVRVTVAQDARGSFIDIRADYQRVMDIHVLDVDVSARQLLLRVEDWGMRLTDSGDDQSPLFLVGHDALSLYVMALPPACGVQTVEQAGVLLQPHAARDAQRN